MTRGKQWVAQRVPDDMVVALPNVYIINEVDLKDGANFIASDNLVGYAVEKGWWQAGKEPFVFSEAYSGARDTLIDPRQWKGQCLVTGKAISRTPDRRLPFAVKAAKRLAIKDVAAILRNHEDVAICSDVTQEGSVFQLRSSMPADIGCVWWRAAGEPCTSVLVPWYSGVTEVPKEYYKPVDVRRQLTLENHFSDEAGKFAVDEKLAWWVFKNLQDRVNSGDEKRAKEIRTAWDRFEDALYGWQGGVDHKALKLYGDSPAQARAYLTAYCRRVGRRAMTEAQQLQ
jgi:dipeptidase